MNRTKSVCILAGAAMSLGSVAMAQTADEQRAYAAELMADAATRTSQLAQGDRRFTVDVHGYLQFRYNWNQRDNAPVEGEDDSTVGFQMARTRINASGNIVNEDWGYFVQFGADPEGNFILDDAYGTFRMDTGWQIQFGQFKLPFARETLVDAQYLLAADRSVSETYFGIDRSQGVQIGFEAEQMRFTAAVSDGAGQRNTDFTETFADFAITGRLDFMWAGDWAQANDFTSFPNSEFFGMVGVAGHYQTGGNTFGTGDHSLWALTADVSVEGNGWNVFAAGYYTSFDFEDADTVSDYAFLIQGGLFVTPQTELFGRFDVLFPDSDWGTGQDEDFMSLTFGVNHYFAPESHAAKLTVDFQWFFDSEAETAIALPNSLVGLLPDAGDDQWNLRAQLQIAF